MLTDYDTLNIEQLNNRWYFRMLKILDYQPEDLMNKSLYEYHHAGDSESLMGSFKSGKF